MLRVGTNGDAKNFLQGQFRMNHSLVDLMAWNTNTLDESYCDYDDGWLNYAVSSAVILQAGRCIESGQIKPKL